MTTLTPFDFDKSEPLLSMGKNPEQNEFTLVEVKSIDETAVRKLAEQHITNTIELLKSCPRRADRHELSLSTSISEAQLLKWVRMADLMRVKGLAPGYAELLVQAGVNGLRDLQRRDARKLADALLDHMSPERGRQPLPSAAVIERWIEDSVALEPLLVED